MIAATTREDLLSCISQFIGRHLLFNFYTKQIGDKINMGFWGFGVLGVFVMDEWAVGQWIEGVTSFQKIYGLYGLNILPQVLQWKKLERQNI